MFPYPSGAGLHVGHPLGYIASDIYARFLRMKGYSVLHPFGFDAFGLPAEQYAIETGKHPAITTAENIDNMRRQLRRLGLAHDPRREISTADPRYYRWTQWIFLQIFGSWFDAERQAARPIGSLVEEFEQGVRAPDSPANPDGKPWRAGRGGAAEGRRLLPSRLPRRGAGQLVPGAWDGPGERGGDRRGSLGDRELPRVPPTDAPVDDADHRLRGPVAPRSGPSRLDRLAEDVQQLDRAQRGCRHPVHGLDRHRRDR